jgi:hypothetical protein
MKYSAGRISRALFLAWHHCKIARMAEGVSTGGTITGEGTWDNPRKAPPDDPVTAPHGWTWDRGNRRWRPRKTAGRAGNATAAPGPADQPGAGDPAPGWAGDGPPSPGPGDPRPAFEDIPQAVKDDIAGFAGLVGAPVLALLEAADPYCGSALAQSFEPIVDACLPLMCRSEKIVKYFTSDMSDWMLWGKLAMVLAPVGRAVWEHHVTRTVHVLKDENTGRVTIVRGPAPAEGDHLQPPAQPEFQYAA